jgi:SAM-dependent methyltransferase
LGEPPRIVPPAASSGIEAALDAAILDAAQRPGSALEDAACDFCGSRDNRTVLRANDLLNRLPGFWTVVQCARCGLSYTNPRPRADAILAYYPDTYGCYQPPPAAGSVGGKGIRAALKRMKGAYRRQALRQHFGYYADAYRRSAFWKALTLPLRGEEKARLLPVYPAGGAKPRLLEIGCGVGGYLGAMRDLGWEVIGVEPSEAASTYARAAGLDVRTADIARLDFPRESFDTIVLNMVLEHLPSPKAALERILAWLRPGGELLLAVPDASGFEARVFGAYHYGLQVPTHLYHFTPKTLGQFLPGCSISLCHQHFHRDLKAGLEFWLEDHPRSGWRLLLMLPRRAFAWAALALSLAGRTSRMSVRAVKLADRPSLQ